MRATNFLIFAAVLLFLNGCSKKSGTNEPPEEENRITYEESNAIFPNPERGFIRTMIVFSEGAGLNSSQLSLLRGQNVSLILRLFYLDAFKDGPLSAAQLSLINEDLGKLRGAGLKAILRFGYTDDMEGSDAPLDIVLQHIDQLKPVFEENRDVIAFVQAGFIGAWGEWHSSSNGLATTENRRAVLNKLLEVLPTELMVQVRTPGYKQAIFNTVSPVDSSKGFGNENIARVGHHNDCFLSGGTDYGTYSNIELEKQYISSEATFVPTGGETCPPTNNYNPNCQEGRNEMKLLKWTYLNLDWYPATINAWKTSGCFDEFQRNLGYRLVMKDAKLPEKIAEGGSVAVDINISNSGYAPVYHRKKLLLVLKNTASGEFHDVPLTADIRRCRPGTTRNIKETISAAGIAKGTYALYIRVADESSSLSNRIEYAVRFANNGTWVEEHGGINDLKHQLTIE